jgi:hypothetical protein
VSFKKVKLKELIPKDKGDIKTAQSLKNYSYDQIKTIVPELLMWIQDMNWPVAGPVSEYLKTISEYLTDDIIKILNGTDDTWKYWCVSVFGLNAIKPIDPRLMTEFYRIAANPTKNEVLEEVHELIMELMETK